MDDSVRRREGHPARQVALRSRKDDRDLTFCAAAGKIGA